MAGTASVSGLISGIKTDDVIAKVMELAKRPKQMLEVQKAKDQLELAQWQDINTRVLALQTKCIGISMSSSFLARTATSSDESIASADAGPSALPGIYDIKVTSRAQSHQMASQTYDSMQADIGTGSLNIEFAKNESFTIKVDDNNNTLVGLRDSINRAKKGVTATIVNEGSEESPAYRLMLTSDKTGVDYKMKLTSTGINVNLDQEVQEAKNAVVTLGSGQGAITVSKASNSISDLIPGVTLNVLKADPEKPLTIQVSKDTAGITTAVQDFVTQFNDVAKTLNEQSAYDSNSKDTPPLFGNYQVQSMQNDLMSLVTSPVPGLSGEYSSMSAIGIALGTDGLLTVDSSQLKNALENHQSEVSKLFGSDVDSDSALVRYAASTSDTKISGSRGWHVEITQPARRAQVTAGKEMDAPIAADETLTISGTKISLSAGMTIDQVMSAINGKSSETGLSAYKSGADGTGTGNYISLRSTNYGSRYSLTISSNLSSGALGTSGFGQVLVSPSDAAGESGLGKGVLGSDVTGTINGESCTGVGQILTASASSNSSPLKGFSLIVTATSPMNTSVRFTKGIGASMQDMLSRLTSASGTFTTVQESLNKSIAATDQSIVDMQTKLSSQEERMQAQYSRMESALAKLQNQSSSLAALTASNNNNK